MTSSHRIDHATTRRTTGRRGNTLVLVTAILVLLVIVATAYISRTRVGRATAAAQQQAAIVEERAETIGASIAEEVSEALFVREVAAPVPNAGLFGGTVSSNWPRLPILPGEVRYGVDSQRESIDDPVTGEPRKFYLFPYNKAPYATIPWTNWPDGLGETASLWPIGPGAPTGLVQNALGAPIGAGNPYGNPGFDDNRWLRSTEPVRAAGTPPGSNIPVEGFTHWAHLSNISRPDNGWRIAWDISDIRHRQTANGDPNVLDNLLIPVEQWLPGVAPSGLANQTDFAARRDTWFGQINNFPFFGYVTSYLSPQTALPNLFELKQLGPKGDETVRGTDRWLISSLFTDTDGDGFTDSFWFLAPEPIDRDVRQVVGVSVVDNAGLLDVNVASLFDPQTTSGANPADLALLGFGTGGAPVGFADNPMNQPPVALYNVGAAPDNPLGDLAYNIDRYGGGENPDPSMLLQQRGLRDVEGVSNLAIADTSLQPDLQGLLLSPRERLAFYNRDFRGEFLREDPSDPGSARIPTDLGLRAFGAPEEIELRGHHGQNNHFLATRLELAFDDGDYANNAYVNAFLRTSPFREEVNEYSDQLRNWQLSHDNRRKITAFSGARNDIAPPWLWPTPRFDGDVDYNRDGFPAPVGGEAPPGDPAVLAQLDFDAWNAKRRKLDLRQPMDEPIADYDGGSISLLAPNGAIVAENRRLWREELRRLLKKSMTLDYTFRDGSTRAYQSYLGSPDDELTEGRDRWRLTRKMLASWTANIDQYRDSPEIRTFPDGSRAPIDRPLNPRVVREAVVYPDPNDLAETFFPDERVVFPGNEKHPVIVEVFFALVYPRSKVDVGWYGFPCTSGLQPSEFGVPWGPGQGENFVQFNPGSTLAPNPAVVLAVQLANPYDTPIPLADFSLRIGDRQVPLAVASPQLGVPQNIALQPTTPERPCSAIVYSIPETYSDPNRLGTFATQFRDRWFDYLDLDPGDLFNDQTNDGLADPIELDANGIGPYDRPESILIDGTNFLSLDWDAFESDDVEIELVRNYLDDDGANPVQLVVDRLGKSDISDTSRFSEFASRLYRDDHLPPESKFEVICTPGPGGVPTVDPRSFYSGIRIRDKNVLVTWARASRPWLRDLDFDGVISRDEMRPKFAVSLGSELEVSLVTKDDNEGIDEDGSERDYVGDVISTLEDFGGATIDNPDAVSDAEMWLTGFTFESQFSPQDGAPIRSKPVFFPMQVVVDGNVRTYEGYVYGPGGPEAGDVSNFAPVAANPVRWGEKGMPEVDQYHDGEGFGRFAFQFNHKDDDFEQIGEIANVPLWGPEVRYPIPGNGRAETVRTLSEMLHEDDDLGSETHPIEAGVYRNRFRTFPGFEIGLERDLDTFEIAVPDNDRLHVPVLGAAPSGLQPEQRGEWEAFFATQPRLPAGVGLFDGLVVDGRGDRLEDVDGDGGVVGSNGVVDPDDYRLSNLRSPANARGFTGEASRGLINLNTAPVEVLRALPHFTRLTYDSTEYGGGGYPSDQYGDDPVFAPRVRVPETFLRYRDGAASPTAAPSWGELFVPEIGSQAGVGLPNYLDRGLTEDDLPGFDGFFPGMRNHRGVESIGELRLLQRPLEQNDDQWSRNVNASIEFAGLDPARPFTVYPGEESAARGYRGQTSAFDTRLATDRTSGTALRDLGGTSGVNVPVPDRTPGDAEERNLLFSGVSNLVGVRSDVFTVYFRVRTFRRNAITGIWDATDPEYILSDSRYVMLVDRSKVERPDDKPEIVYLQRLPD